MRSTASAVLRAALVGACLLCAALVPMGCASAGPDSVRVPGGVAAAAVPWPEATFMVLSDTHFYDPALGTSGKAWEDYNNADRKLIKDSAETFDAAIDRVKAARPGFLLVSGDLTKDGELQCHERVAARLKELADAGIRTYVVPGNHDVNNPAAARFLASGGKEPVPTVTPEDFARIYADCGYGQALYRDPSSLSYVAEPVPGLWLLAIDSTKHDRNLGRKTPETSGAVREPTRRWIRDRLTEAAAKGVAVIAMEHHPILEHFDGMLAKYPQYIVDDNWGLAGLLSACNVRVVFTGHYHASSVVMRRWGDGADPALRGKAIVDVETGSLVTWPCTFRMVRLSGGGMTVHTSRIDQLSSYAAAGGSFDADGRLLIERGIRGIGSATMRKLCVPQRDIDAIMPPVVAAILAHYAGDARAPSWDLLPRTGLGPMGSLVVASYDRFAKGIWKLKPPAGVELMEDNDFTLDTEGAWRAIPPAP
jgi:3',5'-cyclic AMP phosphodiesterase CpdA